MGLSTTRTKKTPCNPTLMARLTELLRGLFFGDIPQLDMHGCFTREVPERINDFIDPFLVSGGYVRIVGGMGTGKLMPAIERHLAVLKQKQRITDFWPEETASFIIRI